MPVPAGQEDLAEVVEGDGPAQASRRRTDLLVGTGPPMAHVLELIAVAARTTIPVLIQGESGTGKELVARAIHYTGSRAARPFLTMNCGAIPETLMEDELFGHARGAFTGAHGDKRGIFEEAEGGSLFLDEIGDLYLSCQVKLLRVLQEEEVRRLGETRNRKVDVRIIAATNKELKAEMSARRFREDLFHRISVLPIHLPPCASGARTSRSWWTSSCASSTASSAARSAPSRRRRSIDCRAWPGRGTCGSWRTA